MNLYEVTSSKYSHDEIFIVQYCVAGSKCNGTYLAQAKGKKAAIAKVKSIDSSYCRCSAEEVKTPDRLEDCTILGCLGSDLIEPEDIEQCRVQGLVHLESGT